MPKVRFDISRSSTESLSFITIIKISQLTTFCFQQAFFLKVLCLFSIFQRLSSKKTRKAIINQICWYANTFFSITAGWTRTLFFVELFGTDQTVCVCCFNLKTRYAKKDKNGSSFAFLLIKLSFFKINFRAYLMKVSLARFVIAESH